MLALDIDNLGDATLRQIMKQYRVRSVRGLFDLSRSELARLERFGEKSAANLFESLQQARKCEDFRLLAALNIPNVGVNVAKLLLKEYTFAQLRELPEEELGNIRGIGPERAAALRRTFTEEKAFIDDLLEAVDLRNSTGSLAAPTVCFTGKMPEKRSFYESLAKEYGMEPVDQVTESLSLLVAADPAEKSTKLERAAKWGTEIISADEFLKRCPPKNQPEEDEQLSLF